MDKATAVEHVKQYADVVRHHFNVARVVLYGSYARGTAYEDSDIDVAVIIDRLDGDWLTSAAELWRLSHDIDFRIEPVLLTASDDRSGFLEHVLRTGEVIYSRDS
jgi:predicted nucleotidyltransferase